MAPFFCALSAGEYPCLHLRANLELTCCSMLQGKLVQIQRGPATVTGYERRMKVTVDAYGRQWEGRGK